MVKVALLAENFYEDMELQYPLYRLQEEGFQVDVVGTEKGVEYKGKHGYPVVSDLATSEVKADDYDAVVIPGGYAPDHMRRHEATLNFVKEMDKQGKVVAAICHAGWILCSCCDLKGRKVTSFFAIKDDMINAGADWSDEETVVDGNLITARKPSDLPSFCKAIIAKLK